MMMMMMMIILFKTTYEEGFPKEIKNKCSINIV